MRKFYIIECSQFPQWSADYVRSLIDHAEIIGKNVTEEWVEEIADKHGCRIEWIGIPEDSSDSVKKSE